MKRSYLIVQVLLYGVAILLMAACSIGKQPSPAAAGIYSDTTYLCRNARQFTAHFDRNGEQASLLFDGANHTLARAAPEPVFSDDFYTLYVQNNGVMHLDRFDIPIRENCASFRA